MILDRKIRTINRVRAKVSGTAERPRLAVFRSLTGISGQLIDDQKGVTLISVAGKDASEAGKTMAKKAVEMKIQEAVFDRRSYRYHGRVKAFAEGARDGGLKI
ncbi:TPA: 50S ribosomal protein L18 [Candidatus Berkelbacteria bacterium]|uniref:Large ribosomal subunit protein uL18 n=1 Tax=Berkelbacteria bacterium GW2011_GWE1_39_12 TaxID=1618337 RepID=A0A0G4B405_9BACT|nr:MAG: LSU ribosomal protein L18P [Berkelbacteria bacterium GW2011_GWE1_39_12]HBO60212.1 50S ribosomal protein L18 [Candidatus Berkelbacteria bacterium]